MRAWAPQEVSLLVLLHPWPGPFSSFSKAGAQGCGDTLGQTVGFPAKDSVANRILKAVTPNGWAEVWVFRDGSLGQRFSLSL